MKRQLSRISLGILSILASATSFADAAPAPAAATPAPEPSNYKQAAVQPVVVKTLKDGFYLGAALGYDIYHARQNMSFTDDDGDVFTNDPELSIGGIVEGIFAGYGKYNRSWYIGAEIFGYNRSYTKGYTLSASEADGSGLAYVTSIQVRANYGISLIPGYKVNDSSLLYLRLGYNRGHLQVTETANDFDAGSANAKANQWQGGFNWGVGIETAITNNVSVRTEYSHTSFANFTNTQTQTRYSFSDNQFQLGVLYHFA